MLLRMFVHSAVFTVAIAAGAVAMNGMGFLDAKEPGNSRYAATGSHYGGDRVYGGERNTFSSMGRKNWGPHDDD